ncbi:MAG: hypothetical protein JWO96_846 [Candidatus Saccharibacteria bacterium]|nr:hypothetical protein [Candidatus Saccharibacteria bacterium]
MSELPKWDIVPQLAPQEMLPIPENVDENWCSLVNYLYSGKEYQTAVFAGYYWQPRLSAEGEIIPGTDDLKHLTDSQGDYEEHTVMGTLLSVGVKKSNLLYRRRYGVPFARLASAEDLDQGTALYQRIGHHILMPLTRTQELLLYQQ